PLDAAVKFTENGKVQKIGDAGLWKTAGMMKFSIDLLDTTLCSTASEAVVPDASKDLPFAMRLKLVGGKLTEIETIIVHDGDYKVSGSTFASNTGAIIASDKTVMWESTIPAAMQDKRETILAWMDKYFRVFPAGVCDTTSDC